MKIKNYALCALAVLALSLTNCNDEEPDYPTDVSFDMLLSEWCCTGFLTCSNEWFTSVSDDAVGHDGDVVIINNNEELKNYVAFSDDVEIDVDFSKHTLLLVYQYGSRFITDSGIVVKNFQQVSADRFRLDIELTLWGTQPDIACGSNWHIIIVTDKINDGSFFELDIIERVL